MNRELEMAKLACHALDEKKGKDIKVIDIHEVSVIADYFVIASASNQNQVQAMVDNVDETLGRAGFEAKQIEGTRNSSWVLMDYGDMIIHIFDELDGDEGILVASKIADRVGITRSVIVNALRKFESAGVIESRSSGMKGTYIKVLNDVVFDELKTLKAEAPGSAR